MTEATSKENIQKVKAVLETDRRYTCEKVPIEIGISHGSVYKILTNKLNMRHIAAEH